MYEVIQGNSLEVLKTIPDNSVDSVVTDPPYELGFMGKAWDSTGIAYSVELWKECLRVLKPGGHLIAFSGSRTYHRMTVAIEDAGFDIRDQLLWLYGSGFPKSMDISKQIDKMEGAERELVTSNSGLHKNNVLTDYSHRNLKTNTPVTTSNTPVTALAKKWAGWGTSLKPAHEPMCLARKPFKGNTVSNVLKFGVGALNIAACRVGSEITKTMSSGNASSIYFNGAFSKIARENPPGRFPANLIHDGSIEVLAIFPGDANYSDNSENIDLEDSNARYFYCAKASKKDRDAGLDEFTKVRAGSMSATLDGSMLTGSGNERETARANNHPTVKPVDLMRYLVRLVTPKGGLVLDPFMGSGSTGKAAMLEGCRFTGIDLDENYIKISEARIVHALEEYENEQANIEKAA
jgi:DNA modification methylase